MKVLKPRGPGAYIQFYANFFLIIWTNAIWIYNNIHNHLGEIKKNVCVMGNRSEIF